MIVRTGKEHPGASDVAVSKRAVRMQTIRAGEAGQRIDNYLLAVFKGVPRSHVYRVLRKGEVRVNKARVKPEYRLLEGDIVRLPPMRVAEPTARQPIPVSRIEPLRAAILHEDEHLLVLNKPSGWAVHGGSGVPYGVIEAMRELRSDLPDLELVHRLDRETSGCLLLAKDRATLVTLHEQLREGSIRKHYLALTRGEWPKSLRHVDLALRKSVVRSGERMVMGADDGKASHTEFAVREYLGAATLLEVALLTGRTHQIRVHAAHAAHPLAGDEKYGDAEFNRQMKQYGLKRLFLHAYSLVLPGYGPTGSLSLRAPLPDDLRHVLEALRSDGAATV